MPIAPTGTCVSTLYVAKPAILAVTAAFARPPPSATAASVLRPVKRHPNARARVNVPARNRALTQRAGNRNSEHFCSLHSRLQRTQCRTPFQGFKLGPDRRVAGILTIQPEASRWVHRFSMVQLRSSRWAKRFSVVQLRSSRWAKRFSVVQLRSSRWAKRFSVVQLRSSRWAKRFSMV